MKITGEKKLFAIEWDVCVYHPPYYYGYLCFWINNLPVGRPGEFVTISIAISYLSDFLKYSGQRVYKESEKFDKHELFNFIYNVFFDGSLKTMADYESASIFKDKFWLDYVGEYSFIDKFGVILIDEPNEKRQRLIWKIFDSNEIHEYYLPEMFFDKIAIQFLNEVNDQIVELIEKK